MRPVRPLCLPVPCPRGRAPSKCPDPTAPRGPRVGVLRGCGERPTSWESSGLGDPSLPVRTVLGPSALPPGPGLRGASHTRPERPHGTLPLSSGAPLTVGPVFSPRSLWATTRPPGGKGGGLQGGPRTACSPTAGARQAPRLQEAWAGLAWPGRCWGGGALGRGLQGSRSSQARLDDGWKSRSCSASGRPFPEPHGRRLRRARPCPRVAVPLA